MVNRQALAVPALAKPVLLRLQEAGYESYVVGGAVRDLLLQRPISDVDIATSARPEHVQGLFEHTIPTGLQHGTVTVVLSSGEHLEITTYRSDGPYVDGRHPSYVEFGKTIEDDLARRDFTMNAMALSLDGTLLDPFGGLEDLQQKILSAVGDPVLRFQEDALRMVRALRFAATYELTLHPRTFSAIQSLGSGIRCVSLERVGHELLKLSHGSWSVSLSAMVASGLWSHLPAPLSRLHEGFKQLLEFRENVEEFGSLCPTGLSGIATWFVLLENGPHDVAQVCRKTALGHRAAEYVLKLSQLGQLMVQEAPFQWTHELLYQFGQKVSVDALSMVRWLRPKDADRLDLEYAKTAQSQPLWTLSELAVDGRDIRQLGCEGPCIGQMLALLVKQVLCKNIPNHRERLLEFARVQITRGMDKHDETTHEKTR
jgi:tRNA nucleotidyltransferase (CCA-adding enzyme)